MALPGNNANSFSAVESFLNSICCLSTPPAGPYNTVIGQTALGALGITDSASLATKLGINASDISYFNVDPTTFDIQAKIDVSYEIPASAFFQGYQAALPITKFLDNESKVTKINSSAFRNTLINEIKFPSVTTILNGAFAGTKLTKLTDDEFPSLTTIISYYYDGSFAACNDLEIVNLSSVINLYGECFANCLTLKTITLANAVIVGTAHPDDSNYPSTNGFANGCNALENVHLPSATTIGGFAFGNCTALTSISLPVATTIGGGAFSNCTSLTSVSIPIATTIGGGAFSNCTSLTSVSLPFATTIGGSAFSNCTSLTSVSLPAATSIGIIAFNGSTSLTSISIPSVNTLSNDLPSYSTFWNGFDSLQNQTITLTIPAAMNNDLAVLDFMNRNTVTIINPPLL